VEREDDGIAQQSAIALHVSAVGSNPRAQALRRPQFDRERATGIELERNHLEAARDLDRLPLAPSNAESRGR
jgi:hypothetical protein